MPNVMSNERRPVHQDAPPGVQEYASGRGPRVPNFDPTVGVGPVRTTQTNSPVPRNRLVAIGDSLTQGFISGSVFATDISYPAIIAYEMGCLGSLRYPRYAGHGGIPLNLELLLREVEDRVGSHLSLWEAPLALFRAREWMDRLEDYWERGPGASASAIASYNHVLAMYGWDLRDVLERTARSCEAGLHRPKDDLLSQVVESNSDRAALRVYPRWDEATANQTLLQAAEALGKDGEGDQEGIETLIVFLGANNCLGSVTRLRVSWSGEDYEDLNAKNAYTVWRPEHFLAEYREVVDQVKAIRARHVIWCTVPHVTIAPIARGLGGKLAAGSRYFPYYTRPWIDSRSFSPSQDPCISGDQARAVDTAIDMYNDGIEGHVRQGREEGRDWYLLDVAGLLDRLASRRYIEDINARPSWWSPYPLPPQLAALTPVPDSTFLTADGTGGRATGGLFSLDGVHPTTVGYGLIAQEMINVMRLAGVEFFQGQGALRTDPVTVDFGRLLIRDSLVLRPPQLLDAALGTLGWADQAVDWVRKAIGFRP